MSAPVFASLVLDARTWQRVEVVGIAPGARALIRAVNRTQLRDGSTLEVGQVVWASLSELRFESDKVH